MSVENFQSSPSEHAFAARGAKGGQHAMNCCCLSYMLRTQPTKMLRLGAVSSKQAEQQEAWLKRRTQLLETLRGVFGHEDFRGNQEVRHQPQ